MDRYAKQRAFGLAVRAATALVLAVMAIVIGVTLARGGRVLLTDPAIAITPPGSRYMLEANGGFLHAMLGTAVHRRPATVVSMVPRRLDGDVPPERLLQRAVLGRREHVPERAVGHAPIVYGVFVLTIVIAIGARTSLFFGIIAIAVFQYPIMTRTRTRRCGPPLIRCARRRTGWGRPVLRARS